MCDVPSITVFCNESVECFPGTASKIFPKASRYYPSGSSYYWYDRTFQVIIIIIIIIITIIINVFIIISLQLCRICNRPLGC